MKKTQRSGSSFKFYVMQVALFVITIALTFFFTIPLIETVRTAMKYPQFSAKVRDNEADIQSMKKEVDMTGAIQFMGAHGKKDSEAEVDLVKQVEDLRRQIEVKELENKHLKDEMALVQTMLQMINTKPTPAASPAIDFWHRLAEISAKILGCIGSLVSGFMFVLAWWRTRKKPQESATA